jgi:hypothetical protein
VPRRELLSRLVISLIAVVLVAWFGVLARDARIGQRASDRLIHSLNPSDAEWSRSLADFRRAELLNPGGYWRLVRARYLLARDKRRALALADSIVRDEPDNLEAWFIVAEASRTVDTRRFRSALREIGRLDRLAPRR